MNIAPTTQNAARPTVDQFASALRIVGANLGAGHADYCFEGRFQFPLGNGWSLVISPEDAGRIRLDACLRGRPRATMLCAVSNETRLAELAVAARDEALALVA